MTAAIDLAGGRASPLKWRQNYDRKLQLMDTNINVTIYTMELSVCSTLELVKYISANESKKTAMHNKIFGSA